MTRKTPQQKKRLSYLKDRRNTYAENSKSSRQSIRQHKRYVNKANRRYAERHIAELAGKPDSDILEAAELQVVSRRPKRWAKMADEPLGDVVQDKLARRVKAGIDQPSRARKRIKRVRQRSKQ